MQTQAHPNGAKILADFQAWAEQAQPRDTERDRQEIELRMSSPKRPGNVDAADVNDCPLFVAANEPTLL